MVRNFFRDCRSHILPIAIERDQSPQRIVAAGLGQSSRCCILTVSITLLIAVGAASAQPPEIVEDHALSAESRPTAPLGKFAQNEPSKSNQQKEREDWIKSLQGGPVSKLENQPERIQVPFEMRARLIAHQNNFISWYKKIIDDYGGDLVAAKVENLYLKHSGGLPPRAPLKNYAVRSTSHYNLFSIRHMEVLRLQGNFSGAPLATLVKAGDQLKISDLAQIDAGMRRLPEFEVKMREFLDRDLDLSVGIYALAEHDRLAGAGEKRAKLEAAWRALDREIKDHTNTKLFDAPLGMPVGKRVAQGGIAPRDGP